MQKVYYRILFFGITILLLINVLSFLIGFNYKQLINPSFYDERVLSLYYISKNFILETGINMQDITQDDIDTLIEKANDIYGADKDILSLIVSLPNQYSLTVTGGMGLSTISVYDFLNSSFTNPYDYEDNIMAAAETISKLKLKGLSNEQIITRFIIGKDENNVKLLAKSEYLRAYHLAAQYKQNKKD